jgi:hypothetical protein
MMTKQHSKAYDVLVDPYDSDCLTLLGKESWPDIDYTTEPKSMGEVIINAANYAIVGCGSEPPLIPDGYHYTYMDDKVLWVEPRHPYNTYVDPRNHS